MADGSDDDDYLRVDVERQKANISTTQNSQVDQT